MDHFYKLRRKTDNLFLCSPKSSKWTKIGKYFTASDLIKYLKSVYSVLPGVETFPADWEVLEFYVVETESKNLNKFIKYNVKSPFLKH